MSTSTTIGSVSASLRELLIGERVDPFTFEVTILAPDEPGGNLRINLFLYKVQENPHLKNMDWQLKQGTPNQLVPPPLSVNLYYLLTPYAPNDPETGNSAAHAILGEAMRVFYENPIVPDNYLPDELQDAREQIKIMLNTVDVDELSKVWSTFTQPFRLSVLYEVSVVQLDVLASERPMAPRVRQIGVPDVRVPFRPPAEQRTKLASGPTETTKPVPDVRTPFHPPVVDRIDPPRGKTETVISFYGANLIGWQAHVTMMGRVIIDGVKLTPVNAKNNIFTMKVPADVPLGFHEIQVDIAHLFRRTFFFEVIV